MKRLLDMIVATAQMATPKVAHIVLTHSDKLPDIKPGQFVQVQVPDGGVTLRRPISVHDVDYTQNQLHLLVAAVGRGTRSLAKVKAGDTISVMLPLGNGFPHTPEGLGQGKTLEESHILLVGGGIGIAPLLYLGQTLKMNGASPVFLLGGRTKTDFARLDEYERTAPVFVTTEDGSLGEKGFVTDHPMLASDSFTHAMVCGPTPMMRAVGDWARAKGTECFVSLENQMSCGLGACLCCVHKNKEDHNVCVCTEGPVFNIKELNTL